MFDLNEELIDMGPPDVGSVGGSAWVDPDFAVRRPRGKKTCPCPTLSVLCNSISASKSKSGCGFSEFRHDDLPLHKFYLTQTDHYVRDDFSCSTSGSGVSNCDSHRDQTTVDSYSVDDSGNCTRNPIACSGSFSQNNPLPFGRHCSGSWVSGGTFVCHESTHCDICYVPIGDCSPVVDSPTHKGCTVTHSGSGGDPCGTNTVTQSEDVTLSDEYVSTDLIAAAVAALPAYADCFSCTSHITDSACTNLIAGQGCTCSAFRNLSTDETSYTIRRFKYKFRFKGSPTLHYKILWNETFKPTLTASVTYCGSSHAAGSEDPDPTHWTVTAKTYDKTFDSKCEKPETEPTAPLGADTEFDSSVFTVNEPTTNGTVYLTDIRWTVDETTPYDPSPSSIEGVDEFAGSSTSYLCNSRTAAQQNCIAALE